MCYGMDPAEYAFAKGIKVPEQRLDPPEQEFPDWEALEEDRYRKAFPYCEDYED